MLICRGKIVGVQDLRAIFDAVMAGSQMRAIVSTENQGDERRLAEVRCEFIRRGTTLKEWCRVSGIPYSSARHAILHSGIRLRRIAQIRQTLYRELGARSNSQQFSSVTEGGVR